MTDDLPRRRRAQRSGRCAAPSFGRARLPGAVPVRRIGARQHRPRCRHRSRRDRPGDCDRGGGRVRRRPAARLVDGDRGAWRDAVGRTTSMLSPCARTRPPAPAADARRRHLERRPHDEARILTGLASVLSGTVITIVFASLDDRAGRRRAVHGAGPCRRLRLAPRALRPGGRVPPARRVVRQGAGEPMSVPAETFDPIAEGTARVGARDHAPGVACEPRAPRWHREHDPAGLGGRGRARS